MSWKEYILIVLMPLAAWLFGLSNCVSTFVMFFSTFPIWRQNCNIWKRFFYLYWAALLCLSACSAFLVFLTADTQLLWAFTISVFEESHATCNNFTLLAVSHHLINLFPHYMKNRFERVNSATTILAFAAPETTLILRTLWPESCQNLLGFWMQNSEFNSCQPVPCPELFPPVYLYKLHPESRGFGTWANFTLDHDIIYTEATVAPPWQSHFYTLGVSLRFLHMRQLLSTSRLGSHIALISLLFLHRPRTSGHGTLCYFPKQLFPL